MSRITFNIAAKCDKAGRSQNQDNYWVCPDLSRATESFDDILGKDKDITLSKKGALLVVADGMGGMNAGEKASELVIAKVKEYFSAVPDAVLNDENSIQSFIRKTIIDADASVKSYAKQNPAAEGLGSTIVLMWILGEKAYCGWCGDSRIYRFNPNNELVRLSHDHSYVQGLVDTGKILPEEAFDHPDGNIITRSLGDNGEKADPEIRVYDVCERDMFLLCSDGLCGLLHDKEIEEILSLNCSSTKDALATLWEAGAKAGWTDNATIDLLCVAQGGKRPKGVAVGYPEVKPKVVPVKNGAAPKAVVANTQRGGIGKLFRPPYLYILLLLALCLAGYAIFSLSGDKGKAASSNQEFTVETDSNATENVNNNAQDAEDNQQNQQQSQNPQKPQNQNPQKPQSQNQNQNQNQQHNQNQQQNQNLNNIINQLPSDDSQNQEEPPIIGDLRRVYQETYRLWQDVRMRRVATEDEIQRLRSSASNIKKNVSNIRNSQYYNRVKDEVMKWSRLADEINNNYQRYQQSGDYYNGHRYRPNRRPGNGYGYDPGYNPENNPEDNPEREPDRRQSTDDVYNY